MLNLSKWSTQDLENLKAQIEIVLARRKQGYLPLDKAGWDDRLEASDDGLYSSNEKPQ